ncbi:MAG: class I SAM-dependent methyltransferase [Patescibacteria group bacterium]
MPAKKPNDPYRSKAEPNKVLVDFFSHCKPAGWFLDLGCNTGTELQYMGTHGYQCEGIDTDPEAIAICRTRLLTKHVTNTVAIVASAQDFLQEKVAALIAHPKGKGRSYDVIHCWNVLPFLASNEAKAVLAGMCKLSASNGLVFLRVFRDAQPSKHYPEDGPVHLFHIAALKEHFQGYEVLVEKEEYFADEGHPGRPEPHDHAVVSLVIKKPAE